MQNPRNLGFEWLTLNHDGNVAVVVLSDTVK